VSGRSVTVILTGILLTLSARAQVVLDTSSHGIIDLHNSRVRVLVGHDTAGASETYFARDGEWRILLRGGHPQRSDPSLKCERTERNVRFDRVEAVRLPGGEGRIILTAEADGHRLTRSITLRGEVPLFQVVVTDQVSGLHELSHSLSTYAFVPDGRQYREYAPLDFVWTPQLRPDTSDVIADHTFRSPALMLQKGGRFVAMIPDVELIQPWRNVETAADLQVTADPSPMLSYGIMDWRTRSHVFYTHVDQMTSLLEDSRLSYGYTLWLSADAPARQGYRDIVRSLWDRWGRGELSRPTGPQSEPFSVYVQRAWKEYLPQVKVGATYAGRSVTLLKQERLAWSNRLPPSANTDCWFNVWFNALRTAYGAFQYAREKEDVRLQWAMEGVLDLALLAPRNEGIAPSIFYLDSAGGHWVNDHGWGGIDGGRNLPLFHNAWTGVWLLEWAELLPQRRGEIMHVAGQLADFCITRQQASGVIPSWYDPGTLQPSPVFRDENAETAGAAYFLSEYYHRTKDVKYLQAAEKAMQYINDSIVSRQKWFDFETFFSCSRKPLGFFDSFTQQFPQNTLSMHQAAEAYGSLFRATNRAEYRERGAAVLDYLCLSQQVWSPPWLSRELFGGFGVQNTDGEWSDARQGYFAITLMKYFELTGKREYFERSVAALRAMFSLFESPSSPRTAENYAHSGRDQPGGVTGLHWGTGSSVVSLQLIQSRYGDAYVDVAGAWGCGVDGCRVDSVDVQGNNVALAIQDNVNRPRTLRLTFGHCPRGSLTLRVNGTPLGTFLSTELEKGVAFKL
jgi:hypothetical protein